MLWIGSRVINLQHLLSRVSPPLLVAHGDVCMQRCLVSSIRPCSQRWVRSPWLVVFTPWPRGPAGWSRGLNEPSTTTHSAAQPGGTKAGGVPCYALSIAYPAPPAAPSPHLTPPLPSPSPGLSLARSAARLGSFRHHAQVVELGRRARRRRRREEDSKLFE